MRGVNRGIDADRGSLRNRARPYLLAILAFLLSTHATVSELAEYAELRAGLRLGDHDGLIRSAPRTYRASLFPGRDIFENRNEQQRGAFRLASLEGDAVAPEDAPQDVSGSLPGAAELPRMRRAAPRHYPAVNRASKGDRRVLKDGSRRVLRVDPRTGRLVRLTLPAPGATEPAPRDGEQRGAPAASDIPLPPNVTALYGTGGAAARPAAAKAPAAAERRNRELMCLAKAVYFEARGEPENGQLAVAQVVLNRVAHPFYPDNVCDVVFQNEQRRNKCQFSFACDGRSDRPRNETAWARAIQLAKKVMHGKRVEGVGNSTHYHATYVRPRWVSDMVELKRIGKHIFYRVRAGS